RNPRFWGLALPPTAFAVLASGPDGEDRELGIAWFLLQAQPIGDTARLPSVLNRESVQWQSAHDGAELAKTSSCNRGNLGSAFGLSAAPIARCDLCDLFDRAPTPNTGGIRLLG